MGPGRTLDEGTVLRLAVAASVDPKTIRKAVRGLPIRGRAGERAREALRAAGIVVAPPVETSGAVDAEDPELAAPVSEPKKGGAW